MTSPKLKGGNFYLLYTLHEGEEWRAIGGFSYDKYLDLLKNRYFEIKTSMVPTKIYPAAAWLMVDLFGFDFKLESLNKRIKN